jgi:protein gp37
MQKNKIEWADYSYNPIVGCSKVSAGCKNCFAHRMISTRFPHLTGYEHGPGMGTDIPLGWDGRAHFKPERLEIPFHWEKPRRIFVCSMSDLFHESLTDEQIAAVFGVMAATPQHQYVVMTKRLHRAMEWCAWANMHFDGLNTVRKLLPDPVYQKIFKQWIILNLSVTYTNAIPDNVIFCASVEDQPTTDERVSLLFQIPARWRGVSVEPMLEGIDFRDYCEGCGSFGLGRHGSGEPSYIHPIHGPQDEIECGPSCQFPPLDLVICGAETGPGKRPFKDEWALDLSDQCKEAGTPFFFKKDGSGKPTLCGVEYHEWVK